MIWIDWLIVAIFSLSALLGLVRGFIKESLSLVTWVAAAVLTKLFGPDVADLFIGHIQSSATRLVIGHIVLFIGIYAFGAIITYTLRTVFYAIQLAAFDRVLGVFFGTCRAFLIVTMISIAMNTFSNVAQHAAWNQSIFVPYFIAFSDQVFEYLNVSNPSI